MHTIPTNVQVQLEHFANLFQDKLNCSTDTLVEVLSTFGKNKSQKMVLPDTRCCETSKTFSSYLAANSSSERAFSTTNNRNRLGVQ